MKVGVDDRIVAGYWIAPWEQAPAEQPDHEPTSAVLASVGQLLQDAPCLDLVKQNAVWHPLSEADIYTYAHSNGLVHGEPWRFMRFVGDVREIYEAFPAAPIDAKSVNRLYGPEMAERCRGRRLAIRLRLRRLDP